MSEDRGLASATDRTTILELTSREDTWILPKKIDFRSEDEKFNTIRETNIVNLTQHDVNIKAGEGPIFVVPPSGKVARLATAVKEIDSKIRYNMFLVPIVKIVYGAPEDLPPEEPNVIYIVSALFGEYATLNKRCDLYAPDSSRAERDSKGQITSVPALVALARV